MTTAAEIRYQYVFGGVDVPVADQAASTAAEDRRRAAAVDQPAPAAGLTREQLVGPDDHASAPGGGRRQTEPLSEQRIRCSHVCLDGVHGGLGTSRRPGRECARQVNAPVAAYQPSDDVGVHGVSQSFVFLSQPEAPEDVTHAVRSESGDEVSNAGVDCDGVAQVFQRVGVLQIVGDVYHMGEPPFSRFVP